MIEHPDEWERFLDEFYEIFSIMGIIKYKIFICGSFGDECFSILEEIKKDITRETFQQHLTFFESDFKSIYRENLVLKLDILAAFSNEIIIVIEQNIGEHMIGIGFILAKREYRNKTSIFISEESPITQLLTPFFTENENLIYFNDNSDLKSKILKLFDITLQ